MVCSSGLAAGKRPVFTGRQAFRSQVDGAHSAEQVASYHSSRKDFYKGKITLHKINFKMSF